MSLAHRPLPKDPSRRGWCPSLARPMPTGDGLLARVHPPLGILSVGQLRAVAEGARLFGNGHVDVTARSNLQIRGVRDATATGLARLLASAGLGDVRADGGPQRLTLTSPLAGLEPGECFDVLALARAIEAAGLDIAGLPAKTLVAIEGAGVAGAEADLTLRANAHGRIVIALAGEDAVTVGAGEAAGNVALLLRAFAATGHRRVRDFSRHERANLLEEYRTDARAHPPLPSAGEGGPRSGSGEGSDGAGEVAAGEFGAGPSPGRSATTLPRGGGRVSPAGPSAGLARLGERIILAVEAPFGRCTADNLSLLADIAGCLGSADIRTTPSRGFVIACADPAAGLAALERLAACGFVTAPDDPRRAIAACPGAPACASGSTATLRDADALAEAFRPFAARGLRAHVSGCAKGCAHPAASDLTLVAEHGRYGVVLAGGPNAVPASRLPFEALLERVRRADPAASLHDIVRTRPA